MHFESVMAQKDKDIGITVKKDENFSEWFTQICAEQGAQLADIRYGVAGFVVHRPTAMKILKKIYQYLEDEFELDNHEPVLMPTVIPKKNLLKEEDHIQGFAPEVFWVDRAGDKKIEEVLALRPTGETAFYPMYSLWVRSYNDLPLKLYQSRMTVFRNEMTTRPFLRGREFMFMESHDVFEKHEDALKQIDSDMQISKRVYYDKMKIPFIFFKRPEWDKFAGADDTYCSDTLMPDGRRSQIGSTHDLGQGFAKAFDITFMDKDGNSQHGWQTCFGPGIWRLMAALIGIHGDDVGLVLPFDMAPLQIVIVPITFKNKPEVSQKVIEFAKKLETDLRTQHFRVKADITEDSPGFKYNKYEMVGTAMRIEVGPREMEEGRVTLVTRSSKEKHSVDVSKIDFEIRKYAEVLDDDIQKKADAYFSHNTKEATTFDELKRTIEEHKGFVKVNWCSVSKSGEACEDKMKEATSGAKVCGTRYDEPETPKKDATCVVCGKKANHVVYVAKSY